jgi:hypothetical protein
MTRVKIPHGYHLAREVPETVVELGEPDGDARPVYLDGNLIGYVRKGERRYSPPTHKGSRIVRYHKMVPEWQGGKERYSRDIRKDTRMEVLRALIAGAQ